MRIRMHKARDEQLHKTGLRRQAHRAVPQVLRQLGEVQAVLPLRGQDATVALGASVVLSSQLIGERFN